MAELDVPTTPVDSPASLSGAHRDFLAQTAKIPFSELQRYFAAGKILVIADGIDLIDVAVAFAKDEAGLIESYLQQARIAQASDAQAQQWLSAQQVLWAVVVDPWVLVQEA